MDNVLQPTVLASGLDQMMQLIVFSVAVLGGFYFILLRPILKQQRKQRREMARLRVGDEVLLTSGIIARIEDMQFREDGAAVLTLDLGGIKVKALPSAIAQRWEDRPADQHAEDPPEAADANQPVDGGA